MEYIVIIIAALLAGVSTGLVGLSAATVMVPLLVTFCPTFQGEHGAFMAIAIALASDVLGSAITTVTYAKNKNIDLKRGLPLIVSIISMCAVGSVVAFFVHQEVMGAFSLILCVAIGIRFIAKPESKNQEQPPKEDKLKAWQIVASIITGLIIGFGTGFFGSGGGMMMLILFTALLNYERKTAVGTSTFVMTFTALIAAVTHILMEPAIVLEYWPYLIVSIAVATLFSYISAKFANKVNSKVVGYVTGVLLFILGLVLIVFHYYPYIGEEYFFETLKTFLWFVIPIIILGVICILIRIFIKIPDFIFRKILHLIAIGMVSVLVIVPTHWFIPEIVMGICMLGILALLLAFEPTSIYKKFFIEKEKHEVLISFFAFAFVIVALIAFFWGLLGDDNKYYVIIAILAWGLGDAAAAICGRLFGKHKVSGKMIEGTKSIEGSIMCFAFAFIVSLILLIVLIHIVWWLALIEALLIGVFVSLTELFTKKGMDTITCPFVAALILFLFSLI